MIVKTPGVMTLKSHSVEKWRKCTANQALRRTAIPLRAIAASELGR
jgi:hypothetical protein